jgi:hypothetical protein
VQSDEPGRGWRYRVALVAAIYVVVGIVFAALAGAAASNSARTAWRLSAFLISAATFVAHLGHERRRLGDSVVAAATHASLAVALGALVLAAKAGAHAFSLPGAQRWHLWAFAVWPLLTGVPAFLAALAIAAALTRRTAR